ncbi:hypothetical protein BC943DRAFT_331068 [Umbelopsis sp. AD052]|nr:hypothetical protein BC943DRAFT_331068 [Umbelopsis sp. AD052]
MFKRAKKELAKQTIATEEFPASDEEEQYLGASSDSDMDDDDLDKFGGFDSDSDSGEEDDIEETVDLKEIIRQKAEESGEDDLDLDDEDALKKLIEEEGLADLDDLEDLEDEGSEDDEDQEDQGSAEEDSAEEGAEGSGAEEEEEEEEEGDMIYSCKICPHRILKNEKAVEVHLQGKVNVVPAVYGKRAPPLTSVRT